MFFPPKECGFRGMVMYHCARSRKLYIFCTKNSYMLLLGANRSCFSANTETGQRAYLSKKSIHSLVR